MNKSQRTNTVKLLYDIVRYAIVGIIFINFVPGKEVSLLSIITGTAIAVIVFLVAYWLDRKED